MWTTTGSVLGDSKLSQSGSIVTNSGTFELPDGTAAAPAYTFTGSSGSGMYRGSSGTILRFSASGSFAFGVSSTGNVLIGGTATTTPGAPLDVMSATGGGNNIARLLYTGTITANEGAVLGLGGYYTGTTPTTFAYIKGAKDNATAGDFAGNLQFWTRPNGGSFTQQMTIASTGYVGMGATPNYRLHVEQTDAYPVYIKRINNSVTAAPALILDASGTLSSNYGGISFRVGGTEMGKIIQEAGGNFYYDYNATAAGGTLYFRSAGSPMMTLTSGGNLSLQGATATAGRAFTTIADLDIYGLRVGRGAGSQTSNTAVGTSALGTNATGINITAIGNSALQNATGSSNTGIGSGVMLNLSTGTNNTAVGHQAGWANTINSNNTSVGQNAALYQTGASNTAIGASAMVGTNGTSTGANNTALGYQAATAVTTGSSNVCLGWGAGNTITTGSQNICIGVGATTAAATNSNTLVIASSGNWVATQGAATTYFTTATAVSTGTLPATCGFIRVLLNGTYVKIPVYAD